MIYAYYFFATILIWLSYRSYRGGIVYERFIREGFSQTVETDLPFATIFAPCRGVDRRFEENLRRLFSQKYRKFEIVFIVDDKKDTAVGLIEDAIRDYSSDTVSARLIIAPKAAESSQKIANLLYAIPQAEPLSDIFAFVDSDACTGPEWLASLVAAAIKHEVGAATGYRWLISDNGKLGSEFASVWNGSVASTLGPNTRSNFCWGGSMAIRREVFDRLDVRTRWEGVLSDDFALTKAVRDAGLELEFVPRALCATFEHQAFLQMLEFTTRQMKITRVYSPHLWLLSMFGSALFCGVMIASVVIGLRSEIGSFPSIASILTLVSVTAFTVAKALIRLRAVRFALKGHEPRLKRQLLPQCVFAFVTPAIFLVNSILALFSRRIAWRGTEYELKSPSETVIIREKR